MRASSGEQDALRRYLLGSLTAEVRESVEKQLFSQDQTFWEHLRAAEESLIDDYLWDELEADEKHQFEHHFLLSSERRGRFEFARALRAYAHATQPEQTSIIQWLRRPVHAPAWSIAVAAVLLLFVLPSLVWQYMPTREAEGEVSVWLASSLSSRVRSMGTNMTRVVAPARCRLLHFRLDPGSGGFGRYRAALHQVDGSEIWSQNQLTPASVDGRVGVTLTLPCDLLPEGDYYIRLHGLPEDSKPVALERYDVRVLRQQ